MKNLDKKLVKRLEGIYRTEELVFCKNDEGTGYEIYLNDEENYEFVDSELKGFLFPNLKEVRFWLKYWSNKPERIYKRK